LATIVALRRHKSCLVHAASAVTTIIISMQESVLTRRKDILLLMIRFLVKVKNSYTSVRL
jgi:hypothetical protein